MPISGNTRSQYNLADPLGCIAKPQNRDGIVERFQDPSVQKMLHADFSVIEAYDPIIAKMERDIISMANHHDPVAYALLQSVPGIGRILGLTILYEIEDINRFPTVQDFASYARLVKCPKESNGKRAGSGGAKIGNCHLKWAFSEAAVLFLKGNDPAKRYLDRLSNKHGKGKALSILAHKIGRAVYYMLKNKKPFDQDKFLGL